MVARVRVWGRVALYLGSRIRAVTMATDRTGQPRASMSQPVVTVYRTVVCGGPCTRLDLGSAHVNPIKYTLRREGQPHMHSKVQAPLQLNQPHRSDTEIRILLRPRARHSEDRARLPFSQLVLAVRSLQNEIDSLPWPARALHPTHGHVDGEQKRIIGSLIDHLQHGIA